ncbi:MAG: antibiotic biosynthesis monooxygenase [Acidimicrobiia bacterium]
MSMTTLSGAFDTSELPRLAPEPITVTVSRLLVPGREAEFEGLAAELVVLVSHFTGCLGAGLLKPGHDGGEHQIVVRFNDALSLRAWERSAERAELMAKIDALVLETRVQRTVGVDTWFELSSRAEPKRPVAAHVATDVAWAFPVVLSASLVVGPMLLGLPLEVRTLLSMTLVTVVMRLGVGPMRGALRKRRRLG